MRIAVSDSNKQFNVTLSPELKKRLQDLAAEYGFEKGTKVGAKIIERYVEHWAETQERIRQEKQRVENEIMDELGRPPLVKGDTERRKNVGRKRR